MSKKRLIPKLQLMPSALSPKKMSLVTTVGFNKIIEIGDPISQAKIYEAQAVDELIFVNLSPYKGYFNQEMVIKIISRASEEIFLPLTIGGGVKKIQDFKLLLNSGADKIAINTAALGSPELITKASEIYGAQCVVVSIDYKINKKGVLEVFSHGGKKATGKDPLEWGLEVEKLGAGEILLTNIDRDGRGNGLDISIIKSITNALKIPVIAGGGCGQAKHFIEGFLEGKADAIAAGTFFCFQDQSPIQTRSHIKNAGIPIRIHT